MESLNIFTTYSYYYDLLYQDKNYPEEANYIQQLLKSHNIQIGGTLLEFGSGTGKHGRLLAQAGYKIHGIERSSEMVARAKQTDYFTCEQGDISQIQLGKSFDAVLALFHVISYQVTNANIHSVFKRAAEHVKPGGLFIFDFWYSPAVYKQRPNVRIKRMADEKVEIIRVAEPDIYPNQNQVNVNYTIFAHDLASNTTQTLTEQHPMRHFSLPEIDLLAEQHHFQRVRTEEFLTGNQASEETWGVCVVLQRA